MDGDLLEWITMKFGISVEERLEKQCLVIINESSRSIAYI